MRKLAYIIVPLILFTSACSEDFLKLTPESSLTSGNFYTTEEQFQQALAGAYAAVRTAVTGEISSWAMGEMRADNTHYDFNPTDRGLGFVNREDIADFIDDASNVVTNDKYNQCYVGISRVNAILDQIPSATFNQATIDYIVAQSRFLRAMFYFELVRYYGGVPLYLHVVKNAASSYLPRSTVEDVYKQILEDVQAAISKLPPTAFPQGGRVQLGAAKMLLADVYMTQKNYGLAAAALKDITQMGYKLLPDYASAFALNNKNSLESIFEAQYQQGNQGQQSNFIYYFIPVTSNAKIITSVDVNNKMGGWNIPTQELINSYEADDERLDVSIAVAEGTGATGAFVVEAVKPVKGYTTPADKTSKLFIKKFLHPHTQQFNTDDNFPVYRYADALLLLAEALNEQGKGTEALPYLNEVRKRAGLDDFLQTDQVILRNTIARERRIELAFENKRWLDLVRTGKAVEVMKQHGIYMKSLYPNLLPATYNVTPERLLFPIPNRETLIGNLNQNPGY